jgi:hypothetical protein
MTDLIGEEQYEKLCHDANLPIGYTDERITLKVINQMMNVECFTCGQRGHFSNQCTSENADPREGRRARDAAATRRQQFDGKKENNQVALVPQIEGKIMAHLETSGRIIEQQGKVIEQIGNGLRQFFGSLQGQQMRSQNVMGQQQQQQPQQQLQIGPGSTRLALGAPPTSQAVPQQSFGPGNHTQRGRDATANGNTLNYQQNQQANQGVNNQGQTVPQTTMRNNAVNMVQDEREVESGVGRTVNPDIQGLADVNATLTENRQNQGN